MCSQKSRIELQPVARDVTSELRIESANDEVRLRRSFAVLRRLLENRQNPNAAELKIAAASRGSIGGEIEFAETAAIGIEREVGAAREIGSGAVLEMRIEIGGRLEDGGEGEDVRGRNRERRRFRRADFAMFKRNE